MESQMHTPDPYAFIEELSRVSSSQEERLRRCRFALEPEPIDDDDDEDEDDDQFRVEPSRIVMVSPPETPEAGGNDENAPPREDVFHTPPEESLLAGSRQNSATVDLPASGEAVDLGRDTDPGFGSEVLLTERFEGGEVQIEPVEIRVVDTGLGLHPEAERNLGVSSNSGEKLNSQSKRLKISDKPEGLRDSSGKAGGPDTREVGVSGHEGASVSVRKSINDIDKFRYAGPSDTKKGKDAGSRGKRALPKSIRGWMDGEAKDDNEFTLLDVLEILAQDCQHDPDAERLSVLEAAKKRGIPFP